MTPEQSMRFEVLRLLLRRRPNASLDDIEKRLKSLSDIILGDDEPEGHVDPTCTTGGRPMPLPNDYADNSRIRVVRDKDLEVELAYESDDIDPYDASKSLKAIMAAYWPNDLAYEIAFHALRPTKSSHESLQDIINTVSGPRQPEEKPKGYRYGTDIDELWRLASVDNVIVPVFWEDPRIHGGAARFLKVDDEGTGWITGSSSTEFRCADDIREWIKKDSRTRNFCYIIP